MHQNEMKNLTRNRFFYASFFTVLLLSFSSQLTAQTDSVKNIGQYLYPKFSRTILSLKEGKDVALILNYNIVTERMVFLQKGQFFDLINYESVDTIYLQNKRFVPFGKVFYEVLVNDSVPLFVQHKGGIQPPARPAAYGGTSQVSSSTYMNYIPLGNDAFRMKSKPEIIIYPESFYWVRKNNAMYGFVNEKQLLKAFSDKKSDIKQYIKKNPIDFYNSNDVIKVVNYYNTLRR
jgi:hypothetical protein